MKIKLILLLCFLTTLVYLPIFGNSFAIDDKDFILQWQTPRSFENLPKLLSGDLPVMQGGVYRPLRSVLYMLYFPIFGTNPFGYHLHSLLLHLLCTVLVYLIIEKLISNFKLQISNWIPFVGALLFGLHPVHIETITYIAASMDSIGILFFLASFYLYITNRYRLSAILSVLAFFSSEITLSLPFIILLYNLFFDKKYKKSIVYFLFAGVYFAFRYFVIGVGARGVYLGNSFYLTMLTMTKAVLKYITMLFVPYPLAQNHIISPGIEAYVYRNYRVDAIMHQSIFDPEILFSITVIIFLIAVAIIKCKKQPLVSFATGWFFLGLLPVLDLVPQGSVFNEKSLYISSVGFILLVGFILVKFDKLVKFIVIGVALIFGLLTFQRNLDWKNDVTIWQKDIEIYGKESAYAHYALGNAYNDREQYPLAIEQYRKSVEINPGFAVGWASLWRTSKDEKYYLKTLEIDPSFFHK